MAVIAQTNVSQAAPGPVTVSRTILSASDTLTYVQGSGQMLILFNTTASPVPATITGSAATTISPQGYGGTISVASGKVVTVPASGTVIVELDEISAYLVGNITVTGGTGVTAHLIV